MIFEGDRWWEKKGSLRCTVDVSRNFHFPLLFYTPFILGVKRGCLWEKRDSDESSSSITEKTPETLLCLWFDYFFSWFNERNKVSLAAAKDNLISSVSMKFDFDSVLVLTREYCNICCVCILHPVDHHQDCNLQGNQCRLFLYSCLKASSIKERKGSVKHFEVKSRHSTSW